MVSIASNGYIETPIENVMKSICRHFTEMVNDIENLTLRIDDVDENDVNISRKMASFIRKVACKIGSFEEFEKEMLYDKKYDLHNFEILHDNFLHHLNK